MDKFLLWLTTLVSLLCVAAICYSLLRTLGA